MDILTPSRKHMKGNSFHQINHTHDIHRSRKNRRNHYHDILSRQQGTELNGDKRQHQRQVRQSIREITTKKLCSMINSPKNTASIPKYFYKYYRKSSKILFYIRTELHVPRDYSKITKETIGK